VTTGGQPATCDIECTLELTDRRLAVRMRRCSLARCFVELEQPIPIGTEAKLHVSISNTEPPETLHVLVERSVHECWIDDVRLRGIELRLVEIGPRFFGHYSSLCDSAEEASTASVTLPLGVGSPRTRKAQPSDRRRANRNPWTLPVRIFWDEIEILGSTRDVSTSGAFIEAEDTPEHGTALHLEFLGDRSFYTEARVVRIEAPEPGLPEGSKGFAVRFLTHDELIHAAQVAAAQRPTPLIQTPQPEPQPEPAPPSRILELHVATPEELGTLFLKQIDKDALFVAGAHGLCEGSEVGVALHFESAQPFVVRARVLRCFDRPPGVGLRVLNRPEAAEWFKTCLRGPI